MDCAAFSRKTFKFSKKQTSKLNMWRILLVTLVSFSTCLGGQKLNRDENYFPLAVWLQSPKNAERYKAAGINTYVGLWRGPTEEQFAELKAVGMKIICHQNKFALGRKDDPSIIAWMQDDEPDNAQSLGEGKGWGPPIAADKVIAAYEAIRAADPSRPVLLNLGQAVAWDNWIGRGVRRNHPEDYADYVKGGDIVSFDIYPATHDHADVKGKLEFVAKGVERLKKWAGPEREVWNCVEALISDDSRVMPHQLRAEVWMSIIHGSRGIIYFVHQFKPVFREASVFEDAELLKAFTEVNRQVAELAPALNTGQTLQVSVKTKSETAPVAALAKKHGENIYLFAVGMSGQQADASIQIEGLAGDYDAEPLNERRRLTVKDGVCDDAFKPYEVHLYKLTRRN